MLLEINQVYKSFFTEDVETLALKGIDLSVNEGEFVSITGKSGAGKSTLLNVLGLLETPDKGTYRLEGKDVGHLSDDERSTIRNEKIGFIFQGFNLIPELNLMDNIILPLRFRKMPADERNDKAFEALKTVGLAGRSKHLPAQLSGGQQQRVAIARAIAGQPRFLLADEPTGNLDSEMALQVFDLIQKLHSDGSTVIVVTHDPELAKVAQRCIRVHDGKCVDLERGTPVVPAVNTSATDLAAN